MEGQALQNPLSTFVDNHHVPELADRKARLAAALLTSIFYALFAVLIWRSFLVVPVSPATPEIVAAVLPDVPKKKPPPPPPLPLHLIRPHPENIILPTFTVASAKPFALALLPPTAADASQIAGGGMSGNGNGGHGGSADGTRTKEGVPVACLDPAWLHAVTMRVMGVLRHMRYPGRARGYVIIHFVASGSGQLDLLEISRSSGDEALDERAYIAMRAAVPLPPIPSRMHTDRVDDYYEMDFNVAPSLLHRLNLCGD